MTLQPTFSFQPVRDRMREKVPQLIAALSGRGWMKGKALANMLDTDDRTIRAIANASDGAIISGQKGYALTHEASVQDVQHAANWLRHQAQAMTRRAMRIEQSMHRRIA